MKKDLLSISDLSIKDIREILDLAEDVKKYRVKYARSLTGKSIALIFQKPSNRTRVSFEIGMVQLGGYAIYLGPGEIDMGARESVKDVACVLARYINAIVARTHRHDDVRELAKHANIPVINGLSDYAHPCQALSDIFTIREHFGSFKNLTIGYIGDGNNVLNSLMCAAAKVGLDIKVATPKGYEPNKEIVYMTKLFTKESGSSVELSNNPASAAKDVDVLYTDVWVSMGQERERNKREKAFKGFQINEATLRLANEDCIVMHCLPAHRGQEISDSVIDSKNSVVYDQAENRMHVEKAILLKLLK